MDGRPPRTRPRRRPAAHRSGPRRRPARRPGAHRSRHGRTAAGYRKRAGGARSIEHAEQAVELSTGRRIAGLERDGVLELTDGLADLVSLDVHAGQVEVRIVPRLVAAGRLGALEPGDGFLRPAQLDQVGADIVVGVAEVRVERDGDLALGDGVLVTPEMAE